MPTLPTLSDLGDVAMCTACTLRARVFALPVCNGCLGRIALSERRNTDKRLHYLLRVDQDPKDVGHIRRDDLLPDEPMTVMHVPDDYQPGFQHAQYFERRKKPRPQVERRLR